MDISKSPKINMCVCFVFRSKNPFFQCRCFVMDDLTEEAVVARLALGGFCQLYTHASVSKYSGRILSATLSSKECVRHTAEAPHEYVCSRLTADVKDFEWKVVYSQTSARPRPLYLSTATQIGLLPCPGTKM